MGINKQIEHATKRISSINITYDYSNLLFSNIQLGHSEKYLQNEKRWIEFLKELINENDFLLPVVLYGDFQKSYKFTEEIFQKIEDGEIDTKEFGKEEIKTINCYSRFMFLCEIIGNMGNYTQLKKEVFRYKKRAFYELKVGDLVTIRTLRVTNRFRYGTPLVSEKEINTKVIRILNKKDEFKIQVKYRNRWFCQSDYPDIIDTGNKGRQFGGCEEIYNIEHGKDKLFEILK